MSDYGNVCGGYILVSSCPCGDRKTVSTYFDCDFEQTSSYDWNWNDDYTKYDWRLYTYGCAVTDPDLCGFTYTQELWTTTDESCNATYHEVWTFGVGTQNPYVVSFAYETNDKVHQRIDQYGETVTTTDGDYTVQTTVNKDICQKCARLYNQTTTKEYYNAENVKVFVAQEYCEYNANNICTRKTDYEYERVTSALNNESYMVKTLQKNTYYNEYGEETSWEKWVYDYSLCYHTPITTYTHSNSDEPEISRAQHYQYNMRFVEYLIAPTCTTNGASLYECPWCGATAQFVANAFGHNMNFANWVVEPTCTQRGSATWVCNHENCDYEDVREAQPYDHNYSYDYNTGMYVCNRCGLENFTGNDGSVVMEDLTEAKGNGTNFVIGYWFTRGGFDYIVAVSLVVDGVEEPILLEVSATDDGTSLIFVDIAAVAAEVEELGYSMYSESVRVNIVPVGGGSFDYAVTLDPLTQPAA